MKKKLIASILAALMVTSMVPASAFAATQNADNGNTTKSAAAPMAVDDDVKAAAETIWNMPAVASLNAGTIANDKGGLKTAIQNGVTAYEGLGNDAAQLKNELKGGQSAYDKYHSTMTAWYKAYGELLLGDLGDTVPEGLFVGGTSRDAFDAFVDTAFEDNTGDSDDNKGFDGIQYGTEAAAKEANTKILNDDIKNLRRQIETAILVAEIIKADNDASTPLLSKITENNYFEPTIDSANSKDYTVKGLKDKVTATGVTDTAIKQLGTDAEKAIDVINLITAVFNTRPDGADKYVGNIDTFTTAKTKAGKFSAEAGTIANDMAQAVSTGVGGIKTEADYDALDAKYRKYSRLASDHFATGKDKIDQGAEVTARLIGRFGETFPRMDNSKDADTNYTNVIDEIGEILTAARTNLDAKALVDEAVAAMGKLPATDKLTLNDAMAVKTANELLQNVTKNDAARAILEKDHSSAISDMKDAVEKITELEKTTTAEDYAKIFMNTYVSALLDKVKAGTLTTDDEGAFDLAKEEWDRVSQLERKLSSSDATLKKVGETTMGKQISDALKTNSTPDGTNEGTIANAIYNRRDTEYLALEKLVGDLAALSSCVTDTNPDNDLEAGDYDGFVKLENKYKALTDFQKTDDTFKSTKATTTPDPFTNKENYAKARAAYEVVREAFDELLPSSEQATAVLQLIKDLGDWQDDNITIEDKDTVYAFAARYNALTKANRDIVDAKTNNKLPKAIRIIDKIVVESIIDTIDKLPPVKENGATKAELDAAAKAIGDARAEYEKLTPSQKDQVANQYTKLVNAEKALSTAQVNYVKDLVTDVLDSNIDPEKLTDEQAAQIKAANDAYDALKAGQKASVDSAMGTVKMENFNKLVSAMEAHMAKAYNLANATVTAEADVTYNGKAQKADSVKVVDALGNEVAADQYTVTYENNKDAGEATVVVTAAADGKYKGVNKTAKFTIKRADIAKVATIAPLVRTYTGKAIYQPESIVTVKGEALDRATEFGMVHKNNVAIKNNAQVTITGKGNYTGKIVKTFKIVPKNVKGNFTLKAGKKALTVKVNKLTGSVKYQYAYRVKGTTTWKYKYSSKNTITIGSLKAGKTYEVKARGYKGTTAAGTFVASTYGNVKTVKVK